MQLRHDHRAARRVTLASHVMNQVETEWSSAEVREYRREQQILGGGRDVSDSSLFCASPNCVEYSGHQYRIPVEEHLAPSAFPATVV
jgi:hypothetical protein